MNSIIFIPLLLFFYTEKVASTLNCGCKTFRPCYKKMLDTLRQPSEAMCTEDTVIGTATVLIFLKAVSKYCDEVVIVNELGHTFEKRPLYEVIIENKSTAKEQKPTIIIDAGQEADAESVEFAIHIIEQLVGCSENRVMSIKAKWVILPSTNPDGLEYSLFGIEEWNKNVKLSENDMSFGVDISRNFQSHWDSCTKGSSGFSPHYAGKDPLSEIESKTISETIDKYRSNLKGYISLRKNGHCLLYPYAYEKPSKTNENTLSLAANISTRINQKSSLVQVFTTDSIYTMNSEPHCGHSVDYVYDLGVPYAYEMRVFMADDNAIVSKYQTFPKLYRSTLRAAYMTAIKELYDTIVREHKMDETT